LEKRTEDIHEEVVKNSDAFARLKKYVDDETSAMLNHLLRIDKKIGLA
jgi:hypothetical protein